MKLNLKFSSLNKLILIQILFFSINSFYIRNAYDAEDYMDSLFAKPNRYSRRRSAQQPDSNNNWLKYHRRESSPMLSEDIFSDIWSGFNDFSNSGKNGEKANNENKDTEDSNISNRENSIFNNQINNLDNLQSSIEIISDEVEQAKNSNPGVQMVNDLQKEFDLPKFNKWKVISKSDVESSTRAKQVSKKSLNNLGNENEKSKTVEINSKDDDVNSSMNFNLLFEGDKVKEQNFDFNLPDEFPINLKDKNGNLIKQMKYKEKIEKPKYLFWEIDGDVIYRIEPEKSGLDSDLYLVPKYFVLKDPKEQEKMLLKLKNQK